MGDYYSRSRYYVGETGLPDSDAVDALPHIREIYIKYDDPAIAGRHCERQPDVRSRRHFHGAEAYIREVYTAFFTCKCLHNVFTRRLRGVIDHIIAVVNCSQLLVGFSQLENHAARCVESSRCRCTGSVRQGGDIRLLQPG